MKSSGGPLTNLAANLRQVLHARASWACLALVMGIQLCITMLGGLHAITWWLETFGLSRAEFLSGKPWQVFTYGMMHGGWLHVGLNGLLLLMIGARIEHIAGGTVMLRATLAGVLSGGLFHLLLGNGLLVGLSGGCLALLLLLTTLSPQSRMMPVALSAKNLGLGILLAALILALINPALNLPGFSMVGRALEALGMGSWFQIGHACHFGGGLAGWIYGRWILRPRVSLASLRRERAKREGL
jgi:membrane associated rhomboid family serine protease